MPDYILFMRNDVDDQVNEANWPTYLGNLGDAGVLRGGSEIGAGECVRQAGPAAALSADIVGFIRIEARDLAHARSLLTGNPVFEAGGTVEIRELPQSR